MTRSTLALHRCTPAYLALCLAVAFATPVAASDVPSTASNTANAANTAAPDNASATDSAAADSLAHPKTLAGVQVTGANTVDAIAPTEGSTVATQPQSIISGAYLRENMAPTADYTDAIALSPSVSTVAPNGPGLMEAQSVNIRGFTDGQFNVTFDGIPWGDSNDFTHHSTSYFTNQDTGSIVVDRGPGTASTLGNATFGGTVSVDSISPKSDFSIEPYLSYGSWNTQVEGALINTGTLDKSGTTAVINVQNGSSDGYLTYAGQRRQNIFAKIVQPIGENTTLTFVGMYNKVNQYVPLGTTRAEMQQYGSNYGLNNNPASQDYYRYNTDRIDTDMAYIGLNSAFSGWTLDNKLYTYAYNHYGYNGLDPNGESPNGTYLSPTDVPGERMRNTYRSFGDIFRLSKEIGPGELRTGFWYDHQKDTRWQLEIDDSQNFAPNASSLLAATDWRMYNQLETFQPFVEYQWNITDSAWLVGGVKYADFTRTINAPVNQKTEQPLDYTKTWGQALPSLAFHYQLDPNWTAYAQWSKGFLAPNMNTLYTVDPASSAALKPQGTTNLQAGTTWSNDRLTLSADVYHIDFTNQILSRTIGGVTYFYNAGGAIYKGFETEGTFILGGGFSVYANASLNRANDKTTGTWMPNTPQKTAALGLLFHEGPFNASLIDKFVGHRYGDVNDSQALGGYAVTNFATSYTFDSSFHDLKNIRIGMQINNIFNNTSIFYLSGYTVAAGTPLYYSLPARSYNMTLSADFF